MSCKRAGRQSDDALDKIILDHLLSDLTFTRLLGRQRPVGKYHTGDALWVQMKRYVLEPGEVGITHRGSAVAPAGIVAKKLTSPV